MHCIKAQTDTLFVASYGRHVLNCFAHTCLLMLCLQVGRFPNWDIWAEWNGKYRDDLRRFIKGDPGGAQGRGQGGGGGTEKWGGLGLRVG